MSGGGEKSNSEGEGLRGLEIGRCSGQKTQENAFGKLVGQILGRDNKKGNDIAKKVNEN